MVKHKGGWVLVIAAVDAPSLELDTVQPFSTDFVHPLGVCIVTRSAALLLT